MTLSNVSSANSTNSATITVPSGGSAPQAGDLIVFAEIKLTAGAPQMVEPAGFQTIARLSSEVGATDAGGIIAYKIADGTEGGTTINGLAANIGQIKLLSIFRDSGGPISKLSVNDLETTITLADPASQTINASGQTTPLIAFALYGSDTHTRTFSPAQDGEVHNTAFWSGYLYWKMYDSSPADIAADMNDGGTNLLFTGYLKLTVNSPPTLSLKSSATSNDSTTVTVPSSALAPAAGDLIVFAEVATKTGAPTMVTPTGFTQIDTDSQELGATDMGARWAYKIADGTEGGTNITGLNASGVNCKKLLAIIHSSGGSVTAVSVNDTGHEISASAPTSQTLTSGGGTPPVIALALFGANGTISTKDFIPPGDAAVFDIGDTVNAEMKMKFYDASPANHVATMLDDGLNALFTAYLNLTVTPAHTDYTFDLATATYAYTAGDNSRGREFTIDTAAYVYAAGVLTKAVSPALATGAYAYTAGAVGKAVSFPTGTGAYSYAASVTGRTKLKFFPEAVIADPHDPAALANNRQEPAVLSRLRVADGRLTLTRVQHAGLSVRPKV